MHTPSFEQIILLIIFILAPLIYFVMQRVGRRLENQIPEEESVAQVRQQVQVIQTPPPTPRASRTRVHGLQAPTISAPLSTSRFTKKSLFGTSRDVRRGIIIMTILRLLRRDRDNIATISRLYVPRAGAGLVRLDNLVEFESVESASRIDRLNRQKKIVGGFSAESVCTLCHVSGNSGRWLENPEWSLTVHFSCHRPGQSTAEDFPRRARPIVGREWVNMTMQQLGKRVNINRLTGSGEAPLL
jgi:hypothetical protein